MPVSEFALTCLVHGERRGVSTRVETVLNATGITRADAARILADLGTIADELRDEVVTLQHTVALAAAGNTSPRLTARLKAARTGAGATAQLTFEAAAGIASGGAGGAITYSASVVRRSDGATLTLGSFSLDPGAGNGRPVFGGSNGQPLPTGFDAFDLASVALAGSDGSRLTASFSDDAVDNPNNVRDKLAASLRVRGEGGVGGQLVFSARRVPGRATDSLFLVAYGLPADAAFTVCVNGAAVGSARSSAQGVVLITDAPVVTLPGGFTLPVVLSPRPAGVDVFALKSLELVNAAGQTVAGAALR